MMTGCRILSFEGLVGDVSVVGVSVVSVVVVGDAEGMRVVVDLVLDAVALCDGVASTAQSVKM